MDNNSLRFYVDKNDPGMEKARMFATALPQDLLEDLVRTIQWRGSAFIDDVYGRPQAGDAPQALAFLSRRVIKDEYFPSVFRGWVTIVISELRKPSWGNDDYEKILTSAYSLPSAMAAGIVRNIETQDVVSLTDPDGTIAWSNIGDRIIDTARRAVNWVGSILQLDWEIDQSQEFDVDVLYEWSKLGDAVYSLEKRASLMRGQALLQAGLTSMQGAGDIEEGDPDFEVGSILGVLSLRNLPKMFNLGKSEKLGRQANIKRLQQLLNRAGYSVTAEGKLVSSGIVHDQGLRSTFENLFSGRPSKNLIAGAAAVTHPRLLSRIFKGLKSGEESGDIKLPEEVIQNVQDEYGDNITEAWLGGDIDSIVAHALSESAGDIDMGDPSVETAIMESVAGDISTVADALPAEVGGVFSRWAVNRAKRKYLKRKRRAQAGASRVNTRMRQKREASRLKAARKNETRAKYMQDFDDLGAGPEEAEFEEAPTVEQPEMPGLEQFDFSGGSDNLSGQEE